MKRPTRLFSNLLLFFVFLLAFATPLFAQDTPTSDFTDNGDGTVTHQKTGLTWMRCSLGQTWTGTTCSGTAQTYSYYNAIQQTANFAGYSDWRLPNIAELQTIVERDNYYPAINTELFPNTPSDVFWSSSPYVGSASYAWFVYFSYGNVSGSIRDSAFPVRLVRASQSLGIGLASLTTDFTDNKDGTVTHQATCLMWQRCSVGQTWNGRTCSGSASTYAFDAAQRLTSPLAGYNDWRIPTASELARLVDYTKAYPGPTINTTLFPNTPRNAFWSSSPYVGDSGSAWGVDFSYGDVYSDSRNGAFPVRLVRASQCLVIGLKPDLATTLSASTDRVSLNQAMTYTATVTNTGKAPASNTSVLFYFPPRGTNYLSVPTDCVSDGVSYRCALGDVAAGASLTRAITVSYTRRGATNIGGLSITDSTESDDSNNLGEVITTITR
jgi:uncharacterized repeat protein (TIGR01451 family)